MSLGTDASCCLVPGTISKAAWMSLVLEEVMTSVPLNALLNLSPDAKNGIFHDYINFKTRKYLGSGNENI